MSRHPTTAFSKMIHTGAPKHHNFQSQSPSSTLIPVSLYLYDEQHDTFEFEEPYHLPSAQLSSPKDALALLKREATARGMIGDLKNYAGQIMIKKKLNGEERYEVADSLVLMRCVREHEALEQKQRQRQKRERKNEDEDDDEDDEDDVAAASIGNIRAVLYLKTHAAAAQVAVKTGKVDDTSSE